MIRRSIPILACLWTAGVSVAALTVSPASVAAQEIEEILSFDVSIDVREGGVMHVREEIRVRALGRQIRRGIFRDVPTSFPRRLNLGRIEAPFEVLSVSRNGRPEPYNLETVGGPLGRRGMRIRIGSPNVLLPEAVHDYVIEYETSRWVTFGEGTDELYWNVTGNDWAFPIESATARVHVEGVEEEPRLEAWTGPEGSTATDAAIRWDDATDTAVFETTDRLIPGEGLTIGVAFPSGLLEQPSEAQRSAWLRLDWGGWIDAGYVILFVVAVYLLMWRRVGMDPPPGRVGVAEEPPEGYSPASLGYIEERGYDQSLLSAALVNMALKGAIRLEQYADSWTVKKVAEPATLDEPLAPEEAALFDKLLGSRSSIDLRRTNHRTLRSAIKAFRSSLAGRLEREYFENNRIWFGVGLAVSVVGFGLLAWRWRFDINPVALFLGFWLTIWSMGVGTLGYRLAEQFREAWRKRAPALWGGVGFLALFS
ncbi:MAG: DUF2207 domain-containing protein, partial [Longimicrobiales bacterium]|nr:DUF2207 domain-containing protein [Longimicrobiales bacterium]